MGINRTHLQHVDMRKDITIQSLIENEDIQIGYLDKDIVIVNSIQKYVEVSAAHLSMNVIVICTEGKIQAVMNDQKVELKKNQVSIIPPNMTVTDLMISPDFNLKAMFFTNRILQSFLREKINVWNEMMYIHRQYIFTLNYDHIVLYNHFYDMLLLAFARKFNSPYHTEIIQSLFQAAILACCGIFEQELTANNVTRREKTADHHFQRFLDLLNNSPCQRRSVASYASELCVSPKHLTTVIKKCSGKTAQQWITEKMLEEIRFYLKQTDLSIKQVSNRLNFPNPSFFGKYVKEHLGVTPKKLRDS